MVAGLAIAALPQWDQSASDQMFDAPLLAKVNAALAPPEVREGFLRVGNEPAGGGPDILAAKVQTELQKWTTIAREKNIRIEQ